MHTHTYDVLAIPCSPPYLSLASSTLCPSRSAPPASPSTSTSTLARRISGSGGKFPPGPSYPAFSHRQFSSSELAHASRYRGHNIYNPAKSSTAKKASGAWNISYGDGSSASGNVYAETVTVGDIAIAGQAVELAEKLSSSFLQDSGNDGLLGLAWPSINTVYPRPVATPVENLINKKLIDPVRSGRSIYARVLG